MGSVQIRKRKIWILYSCRIEKVIQHGNLKQGRDVNGIYWDGY
jgi:hypothetical protein